MKLGGVYVWAIFVAVPQVFVPSGMVSGQQLSEAEQLELLQRADTYYATKGHDHERSIQLYEEVLEKVDLAEPIRLDVLYRVGTMLFSPTLETWKKENFGRAAKVFEQIVQESPLTDWRVLRAHSSLAEIASQQKDYAKAEKRFLSLRALGRSLTPEEKQKLEPFTDTTIQAAAQSVVYMYHVLGADGLDDLRRLIKENKEDTELVALAQEAIADITRREAARTVEETTGGPDGASIPKTKAEEGRDGGHGNRTE